MRSEHGGDRAEFQSHTLSENFRPVGAFWPWLARVPGAHAAWLLTAVPSGLLVTGGWDCAGGGAGFIGGGRGWGGRAADCALELGDSGGDFGLEAVGGKRALVVGQCLHVVALL